MGNWKLIDTSGCVRDLTTFYNFNVQYSPGAGMAGVENLSTDFGLLDGAVFQRTRVPTREFQLLGYISASSGSALHIKRKALINAVKPDRSASQVPLVLQYYGASDVVQASAFYNGGLELGQPTPAHELDMGLRFLQVDPYWEATTSTSQALTCSSAISNANYILQRNSSGMWNALGTGLNGEARAIINSGSTYYIGGAFSTASGANACRVASWNSSTGWSNVGNGTGQNTVCALTLGADSKLYAGGDFVSVSNGTVVACRIAVWDNSAWGAMASGLNSGVISLATGNEGNIYVAGDFNRAGGGAASITACAITYWDGAWNSMASGVTGCLNNNAYAVTIGKDGAAYVGGGFNRAGGEAASIAASGVARWSNGSWSAVGSGISVGTASAVLALAFGADTSLYTGGTFGHTGGAITTACRMAVYNGTQWTPLRSGIQSDFLGAVWSLAIDSSNGWVYAGGELLESAGGITLVDSYTIWTGTDWIPPDINLPGDSAVRAIHIKDDVLTLGFDQSGTASAAAITSINNVGGAATYPILTACAPTSTSAQLVQLINYTSKDYIWFNLALAPGEVVTLDLRRGKKTFTSNFRGNIIGSVLPSSNLASWKLLPGVNNISFFMTSGSGSARLSWTPRYWGIDS